MPPGHKGFSARHLSMLLAARQHTQLSPPTLSSAPHPDCCCDTALRCTEPQARADFLKEKGPGCPTSLCLAVGQPHHPSIAHCPPSQPQPLFYFNSSPGSGSSDHGRAATAQSSTTKLVSWATTGEAKSRGDTELLGLPTVGKGQGVSEAPFKLSWVCTVVKVTFANVK